MIYKNNTISAVVACEADRTGNYGSDFGKKENAEFQTEYIDDKFKHEGCELLKNITPDRKKSDRIYLCRCKYCGRVFIRCRRWLLYGYSDCGCVTRKNEENIKLQDYHIKNLDPLSKKILKMKIDALDNQNLSTAFDILYIRNRKLNEYNAVNNYMSISTLHRCRKKIMNLWDMIKNDYMKEVEDTNVHNESN